MSFPRLCNPFSSTPEWLAIDREEKKECHLEMSQLNHPWDFLAMQPAATPSSQVLPPVGCYSEWDTTQREGGGSVLSWFWCGSATTSRQNPVLLLPLPRYKHRQSQQQQVMSPSWRYLPWGISWATSDSPWKNWKYTCKELYMVHSEYIPCVQNPDSGARSLLCCFPRILWCSLRTPYNSMDLK